MGKEGRKGGDFFGWRVIDYFNQSKAGQMNFSFLLDLFILSSLTSSSSFIFLLFVSKKERLRMQFTLLSNKGIERWDEAEDAKEWKSFKRIKWSARRKYSYPRLCLVRVKWVETEKMKVLRDQNVKAWVRWVREEKEGINFNGQKSFHPLRTSLSSSLKFSSPSFTLV